MYECIQGPLFIIINNYNKIITKTWYKIIMWIYIKNENIYMTKNVLEWLILRMNSKLSKHFKNINGEDYHGLYGYDIKAIISSLIQLN